MHLEVNSAWRRTNSSPSRPFGCGTTPGIMTKKGVCGHLNFHRNGAEEYVIKHSKQWHCARIHCSVTDGAHTDGCPPPNVVSRKMECVEQENYRPMLKGLTSFSRIYAGLEKTLSKPGLASICRLKWNPGSTCTSWAGAIRERFCCTLPSTSLFKSTEKQH